MSKDYSARFGEKIREIRERHGRTMKEVAEKAGISESMLSQIERNKVSPAIDTLLSIVDVLDIDLEYLFADLRRRRAVSIVRQNERHRYETTGVSYELVSRSAGTDDIHAIEAYYLTVAPGLDRGSEEYGHVGREMGVILEGEAELVIGGETHRLSPGDSVSFASDVPHLLRNVGKKPLRTFWVVTPPKHFVQDI
jgi:transcriptional regulator with XRE-family HTH domain